jgi:DNA invertase Pin-like site-specific DNA recombinase
LIPAFQKLTLRLAFEKRRCVSAARVSTLDQSPDLQLQALTAAGCEKVYGEKASGDRADRPELKRVLDDVLRAGDTLVVWKLDRLARSLKQLITTAEDLQSRNIGLVSLTENLDTTTPGGRLVFHVFGAIAEFEKALLKERTMAGLVAARRKGRKGGRPLALTAQDIAAARVLMRADTLLVRDVARRMGISVATLYRHVGKRGHD